MVDGIVEAQIAIGKQVVETSLEMLADKTINSIEQDLTINNEKFTLIIKRGTA